jgi:ubiquinone/menaquinone biosynthesis C-methylase UbiE
MTDPEVERIRKIYARRDVNIDPERYTLFDAAYLCLHHSRQRALLNLLRRVGINTLQGRRVLEVGCGRADILIEYLGYGVNSKDLVGIDLLFDHLSQAHERLPVLQLLCADGRFLPFRDNSFDVVIQYTVFSSVLNDHDRQNLATEMLRVVNPGGLIVSYDFWPNNPSNPDVRGLRFSQIRTLFPYCHYDLQRIVLAPPISRRIAPLSSLVCQALEKLPFLCSHFLVGIMPSKNHVRIR